MITKTPQAEQDFLELASYIAKGSLDAAERFLDAAEAALDLLAGRPEMGIPCRFQSPAAASVRAWSIRGFENYPVFYRPVESGIEVVRVIHGARDIAAIFGGDSDR